MTLFALSQTAITQPGAVEHKPRSEERSARAAQEFEQIFLRQMLGALMKTTRLGPTSSIPGTDIYDSMVVDALSGSIAESGGLGLADVVERNLNARSPQVGERSEPVRREAKRSTEMAMEDSRLSEGRRSVELDTNPNQRIGHRRLP